MDEPRAKTPAPKVSDLDRRFMDAAIRIGRRHLGLTRPNPSVGAIVVRQGPDGPEVVGRGTTSRGGRPHAERNALAEAGERARGATLYVTLEPCSQHGKPTPGCSEAILEAGIARVVTAQEDPDSRVAGRGHAMLRAAGVEVVVGVGAAEAERGLANHFTRMRRGRPRILLKLAVSADGMVGRRREGRVPITGEEARAFAQVMRSELDAVMVGIGTALLDDPSLTVRLPGMEAASPTRIVIDSRARLPLASRLARTAREVPVYLVATEAAPRARVEALREAGVEVLVVPTAPDGHVDLVKALTTLSWKGVPSVLVEGGSELAASLLAQDLVDDLAVFRSAVRVETDGVPAPAALARIETGADDRYLPVDRRRVGADRLTLYRRDGR
ncbi:bifunctional diaminohydroxyphosphoribosylaminopyrimidine deaminase/5-amino-6-(5-phosphoribosylamino)uracil reductase RibD [Prosthecomicrobium sp. N25]